LAPLTIVIVHTVVVGIVLGHVFPLTASPNDIENGAWFIFELKYLNN